MLLALWLAGAAFVGLMGGLSFAATYDPVKWSDAVSAGGTVIAAIGTVGTLAYQVVQTAKAQRQLRTQAMLQEHMEADLVQQWLHELSHITGYLAARLAHDRPISAADLSEWKDHLSVIRDRVQEGRSRISSQMGHQFYLVINDALVRANRLVSRASVPPVFSDLTDVRKIAVELKRMLVEWLDQTEDWRDDLDKRLLNTTN